jgi:hypothetical protein
MDDLLVDCTAAAVQHLAVAHRCYVAASAIWLVLHNDMTVPVMLSLQRIRGIVNTTLVERET